MPKYEYLCVQHDGTQAQLQKALNDYGTQGYRVVKVFPEGETFYGLIIMEKVTGTEDDKEEKKYGFEY